MSREVPPSLNPLLRRGAVSPHSVTVYPSFPVFPAEWGGRKERDDRRGRMKEKKDTSSK